MNVYDNKYVMDFLAIAHDEFFWLDDQDSSMGIKLCHSYDGSWNIMVRTCEFRIIITEERIAIDIFSLFDKAGRCPFQLPLPTKDEHVEFLMNCLEYLRTVDGYKDSMEYNLWVNEYPKLLTEGEKKD